MIEAAKEKAKKIAKRIRLYAELFAIGAVLLVVFASHKGWVTAQFIPPAMAIGGPGETVVAAANNETNQASKPARSTPIKSADASPAPDRKPMQ